jgi:UPF0176 protein
MYFKAKEKKLVQIKVSEKRYQIITFYCFKDMSIVGPRRTLRDGLKLAMSECSIKGTIILADEGFNATLSGLPPDVKKFIPVARRLLREEFEFKTTFHNRSPFRRSEVKSKREIVTLKKDVDLRAGDGTHVGSSEWNRIIADPTTVILDTRNDYEYRTGTFRGAVNPGTSKFSELPDFVRDNLDPKIHRRVAMFCTGGIRCEKFAPYMKSLGFGEVFQLDGGILNYLEQMPAEESLWEGECFVFDDRISLGHDLKKGESNDLSQNQNHFAAEE